MDRKRPPGLVESGRPAAAVGLRRPRGAEGWALEDNVALGCEEMMGSGSSRDRLEETLIDPENRDACGRKRNPTWNRCGAVEQECGCGGGRPARRNYRFIKRRCSQGTSLARPSLTRTGANQRRGRGVQRASGRGGRKCIHMVDYRKKKALVCQAF